MPSWWNNLSLRAKRLSLWCGSFTAMVAAMFSLAQALTATEPVYPALRGWVREEIDRRHQVMARTQIDGQLETIEVRASLVDKELFELDMALRNQPGMIDSVRGTLEARKRALTEDKQNLDYRRDQLQRTRSGRRP